jgi:NADPH:quinone reductase
MKLVQAHRLDSVADYQMVDADTPAPSAEQVLIQVHACGMGYVDALVALGRYQVKPPLPFTPGQEVAGVVTATGDRVSGVKVGDRVMASTFGGGLAEFVAVPAGATLLMPDNMSFAQAAGFRIDHVTALHGLRDRAAIQPGERLLVFGAAGGVGVAAVQVGRRLGAEVIAVASSSAKRDFARKHGAQHVLDTEPEGWRDRLKEICGGKGPDVVFDPVCGPLFELAFRSLGWRGRHLVVGFVGGPIPKLPANLPLMKGAALVGVDVRQFTLFESARAQSHLQELLGWVSRGELAPAVGRIFPFAGFAEAMEFATSGKGSGKTIIELVS